MENSTYDTKNGLSVDCPLRYHREHIKTINCKIHLGVETEVSIFMTGGNRGEILARAVCQQKMIKKLLFLENMNWKWRFND